MWLVLAESTDSISSPVEDGSVKPWHRGSGPLPIVRTTISLKDCCYHACIGERYSKLHSGTTLQLFAEVCSQCVQTSFTEDSHAPTSALLELAAAWAAGSRRYSGRLSGLRKRFARRLCSSKMYGLVLESLSRRSEIRLRDYPTKSETVISPHPMSVYRINERDGSCLPTLLTPCANEGGYNQGGAAGRVGRKRYTLSAMWRKGLIPPPTARDYRHAGYKSDLKRNSPNLPALWKETTGTQCPASFIEWIMGTSFGTSALEPWAIAVRGCNTGRRLGG